MPQAVDARLLPAALTHGARAHGGGQAAAGQNLLHPGDVLEDALAYVQRATRTRQQHKQLVRDLQGQANKQGLMIL